MERKLAAILAADVVGYSALMEVDEAGTHERLKAGRKELFEPEIERHHGRVFKVMGDGMLVEFGSVVDAVECAVSLQRGLAERNAVMPERQRIQVRIGINLGEVIIEGEDRFGEGVNIATRLEQLAEPGGIYVSGKVAKEVEKKLAFGFEPMGEQKVKNIAEPVSVFRIKMDGAVVKPAVRLMTKRPWAMVLAATAALLSFAGIYFWQMGNSDLGIPEKPAIAILPFKNLGEDAKWDRLADVMTEDVITDLSHSKDLLVIAHNSTEIYRGNSVDVRQIGHDLNVSYVLEGSVQPLADRIRATAQLIDATSGSHVWSERYERPASDMFAIEAEITERIAATLTGYEGIVADAQRQVIKRKAPRDMTAFDFYLLGIEAKHEVSHESLIKAEELLSNSIDLDPNFARAYVGLAWVYTYYIILGYTDSVPETVDTLLTVAQKAVALDPNDGETHLVLGQAYLFRAEMDKAAGEIERAVDLAPNNADILLLAAWNWPALGKPEHAVELAERALRLNPRYPYWYIQGLSYIYFFGKDFETSLGYAKRVTSPVASDLAFIAANAAYLGRLDEAKATADRIATLDSIWSAEQWLSDQGGFTREEDAELFAEGTRKAGIRTCLSATELNERPTTRTLKSCNAERTKS